EGGARRISGQLRRREREWSPLQLGKRVEHAMARLREKDEQPENEQDCKRVPARERARPVLNRNRQYSAHGAVLQPLSCGVRKGRRLRRCRTRYALRRRSQACADCVNLSACARRSVVPRAHGATTWMCCCESCAGAFALPTARPRCYEGRYRRLRRICAPRVG